MRRAIGVLAVLLAPVVVAIAVTARLRWGVGLRTLAPVSRYVVEGDSMAPAFGDGERLLVWRWAYLRRPPAAGDAVVLRDPERPGRALLKRVAAAPGDGLLSPAEVWLLGDNARASRDSRQFGPVPAHAVVGRVWRRY